MSTSDAHMAMNVIIDEQKQKVLYVEANSHVVDVLLSFLTLPLGKIMRILENHYGDNKAPVIGSLTTLYRGLTNLDSHLFCVGGAKQMLLNPTSSFEAEWRRLKLDFTYTQPAKYYVCDNSDHTYYISMHCDIAACSCGRPLNKEIHVTRSCKADDADGRFITVLSGLSSFIITDDLHVAPVVTGFVQTLNNLGITDIDGVEMKSFSFGINQVMELLKCCLTSSTPLSDLIIGEREKSFTEDKPHRFDKGVFHSRKMVLKISLQKSTNKFLFAQASEDFVDVLFSFLTVPLGGVESLLGGNTCLNNLTKSISDSIDQKYFKTPDTKSRLIHPKIPYGYISKDEFLPLTQDTTPPTLYCENIRPMGDCISHNYNYNEKGVGSLVSSFKSIEGQENYLSKNAMCFVTDDLTVSIGMATCIPILKRLGVALSDVKEVDLQIGMEEVLSILKASLSSRTALSDVINPMLNKLSIPQLQPKLEC